VERRDRTPRTRGARGVRSGVSPTVEPTGPRSRRRPGRPATPSGRGRSEPPGGWRGSIGHSTPPVGRTTGLRFGSDGRRGRRSSGRRGGEPRVSRRRRTVAATRLLHTADTHVDDPQCHPPARRRDLVEWFGAVGGAVAAGPAPLSTRATSPTTADRSSGICRGCSTTSVGWPTGGSLSGGGGQPRGDPRRSVARPPRAAGGSRAPDRPTGRGGWARSRSTGSTTPSVRRGGLDGVAPHGAERAVLVAHGPFTPFADANRGTETVLAAPSVPFDAAVLGDTHAPGPGASRGYRSTTPARPSGSASPGTTRVATASSRSTGASGSAGGRATPGREPVPAPPDRPRSARSPGVRPRRARRSVPRPGARSSAR
jgi:hypothetical protein